jgi:hypothetical protein
MRPRRRPYPKAPRSRRLAARLRRRRLRRHRQCSTSWRQGTAGDQTYDATQNCGANSRAHGCGMERVGTLALMHPRRGEFSDLPAVRPPRPHIYKASCRDNKPRYHDQRQRAPHLMTQGYRSLPCRRTLSARGRQWRQTLRSSLRHLSQQMSKHEGAARLHRRYRRRGRQTDGRYSNDSLRDLHTQVRCQRESNLPQASKSSEMRSK